MDTLNNHTNCLTVLSNFNSIATRKENSLHKVYLWLFFISQYKSKLHPLGNILCIHVIPHPYEQDLNLWLVPFEFHHELGRANQQCQGRTHSIYLSRVSDPDRIISISRIRIRIRVKKSWNRIRISIKVNAGSGSASNSKSKFRSFGGSKCSHRRSQWGNGGL
jgi:hypothetical protein